MSQNDVISLLEYIKHEIESYELSDEEKDELDEDSIKWGMKIAYDLIDKRIKLMKSDDKKELFTEPLTKGELDLLSHKFKTYLGSVGREILDRRLKDTPYQGDNVLYD